MTFPGITIGQGGPNIPDGVYPVALTKIEGPKTITAKRGPTAGQSSDIYDWTFVVMAGEYQDTEIDATTSTNSGPRSKLFAWITALLGGQPPVVGQTFQLTDLTGRMAFATIQRDESGWPRITSLGAMPTQAVQQVFGQVTGAPVQAPQQPVQAPPAAAAPPPANVIPQHPVPAAPVPQAPPQPVQAPPAPQQPPQQPGQFVMPAGQPQAAPQAPLREQVASGSGDLPF